MVMLTGMGHDGLTGTQALVAAGGAAVAQDEASSVIFGMPRDAVERGAARTVLPLGEIASALIDAANRPSRTFGEKS